MESSKSAELDVVEKSLQSLRKEDNPLKWAKLMNIKGMLLGGKGIYKEAEGAFIDALSVADIELKCKILINYAKIRFFNNDIKGALEILGKVFEITKAVRQSLYNLYLGYAHLLRGQIFYFTKRDKDALGEFRKAEFYFEGCADLRGAGLSCLESARIYVKSKNLTTAWNFLRKSEGFLRRLGDEERFGVAVCKGVALHFSGKEEEALAVLREVYEKGEGLGEGYYTMDEVLDAYLNTRSRMLQYQKALM